MEQAPDTHAAPPQPRGPYDAVNRDPFWDRPSEPASWADAAKSLIFWAAVVAIIYIVRTT